MASSSVSRVTSQNQISIPAAIRRRFRIVAGTELIWEERDGVLIVRPKRYTLADIRAFCAKRPVRTRSSSQMRRARDKALRDKYARR